MIVKCPRCGNLVPDKTAVCPYCGTQLLIRHSKTIEAFPESSKPQPRKNKKKRRWLIPVIISVVLLLDGGAIGSVNGDYSCIAECIQLYNQTRAFSESEATRRFAANDRKLHINIAQIVEDGYLAYNANVFIIRSVVVTGTDVRVRTGPGLEYDPITDSRGKNIHPAKG